MAKRVSYCAHLCIEQHIQAEILILKIIAKAEFVFGGCVAEVNDAIGNNGKTGSGIKHHLSVGTALVTQTIQLAQAAANGYDNLTAGYLTGSQQHRTIGH